MRMRHLIAIVAAVVLGATAQAVQLIGLNSNGSVFTLETTTLTQTFVNNIGVSSTFNMAYNPADGFFYVAANFNLYRFSLGGTAVQRRSLGFLTDSTPNFAIDRTGVCWLLDGTTGTLWSCGTLSNETAVATVRPELKNSILCFNKDGSLNALNGATTPANAGLFIIDKATGDDTQVNTTDLSGIVFGGACPTSDSLGLGDFFDFFNTGYTLDGQTGALSTLGGTTASYFGLALPGNYPFAHPVSLGTVSLGQATLNNPTCLVDRDRDVLRICKFFVPNQTSPFVLFTATSQVSANPSSLDLLFTQRMVTSGSFRVTVRVKNVNTNVFDGLTSFTPTTSFRTVNIRIQNPANYMTASRIVTFQFEVKQTGPASGITPCYEVDQLVTQTIVP